jgi:hypothetical protein
MCKKSSFWGNKFKTKNVISYIGYIKTEYFFLCVLRLREEYKPTKNTQRFWKTHNHLKYGFTCSPKIHYVHGNDFWKAVFILSSLSSNQLILNFLVGKWFDCFFLMDLICFIIEYKNIFQLIWWTLDVSLSQKRILVNRAFNNIVCKPKTIF